MSNGLLVLLAALRPDKLISLKLHTAHEPSHFAAWDPSASSLDAWRRMTPVPLPVAKRSFSARLARCRFPSGSLPGTSDAASFRHRSRGATNIRPSRIEAMPALPFRVSRGRSIAERSFSCKGKITDEDSADSLQLGAPACGIHRHPVARSAASAHCLGRSRITATEFQVQQQHPTHIQEALDGSYARRI